MVGCVYLLFSQLRKREIWEINDKVGYLCQAWGNVTGVSWSFLMKPVMGVDGSKKGNFRVTELLNSPIRCFHVNFVKFLRTSFSRNPPVNCIFNLCHWSLSIPPQNSRKAGIFNIFCGIERNHCQEMGEAFMPDGNKCSFRVETFCCYILTALLMLY